MLHCLHARLQTMNFLLYSRQIKQWGGGTQQPQQTTKQLTGTMSPSKVFSIGASL